MNCRLLFNEEPITINRLAAKVLGLNEAIVVQQIHYWLNINEKAKKNIIDDKVWTFNTYEKWQKENFDFWSVKTIKRIFDSLEKKGILIKGRYNQKKYDRTLWVTLNYEKLEAILVEYEYENKAKEKDVENVENVEISTKGQNVPMSNCNKGTSCPHGTGQVVPLVRDRLSPPIPETTKETKTEISITTQSVQNVPVVNTNKELIEAKTHLLLDSKNKIDKVSKWKQDRLLKAIDIFNESEGQYFTLLEKIYKDDKNFTNYNKKNSIKPKLKGGLGAAKMIIGDKEFSEYEEDELNRLIEEKQKEKWSWN